MAGATACSGSFHEVREPFHASVATGTSPVVSVTNVVGEVRVEPGDGSTVVVDATKYASNRAELASIDVAARKTAAGVAVETTYRNGHGGGGVSYNIIVPRDAAVRISNTVGTIKVGAAGGDVVVRTATGTIDARLGRVAAHRLVDLQTATGTISLRIAADSSANVAASAALGSISSDFPSILANRSNLVGSTAAGRIGEGTATIRLTVKTGSISIDRD